jgi:hypothetical protein
MTLPSPLRILVLSTLIIFIYSCKKSSEVSEHTAPLKNPKLQSLVSTGSGTCYETLEPDWNGDSVLTPTILGYHLVNNPYSVSVMQQAAVNLYGNANGITANKKYVRFKPSGDAQLEQLDNLDLDLFDYPLDYEVVQEGDYYDQGLPSEEIPWLYTVVDIAFVPPAGIQYETLANLYVPADDIYLENEAFRITGNPVESLDCDNSLVDKTAKTSRVAVPQCPPDYHWDYGLHQCVANDCPSGYHWDGSACVPDAPPPPPPPPPSKQPSGQILVFDNAIGNNVPVRQTRVVLKRFLKIDRTYTNDNGNFSSGKHFHNKVNIVVKFKNNLMRATAIRGARYWQMFFPIKHGLGKYSGNLSNLSFVFTEATDRVSRAYRNWWAAQLMNAYLEYNQHAAALGTGILPTDLRIVLTAWIDARGSGSTVMDYHRTNESQPPREFFQYFLADPATTTGASILNNIQSGFFHFIDMTLGYRVRVQWSSDRIKALMYHEMTHAAHFQKVGQQWWNSLVYAEEFTITGSPAALDPYGNGTDGVASEYISVAESWAEYLARVMCDRQYGASSQEVLGWTRNYFNNIPRPLTSHLNYLEDYDPHDANNPFRWIPEGLYYDLFDANNETIGTGGPVNDGVAGYTSSQMFNALDADVTSMPQYRTRLLQENGNNQLPQVIDLFAQYGY